MCNCGLEGDCGPSAEKFEIRKEYGESMVNTSVNENYDFIIYSKPDCAWCIKAKKLIEKNYMTYHEIVIGKDVDRDIFTESFPHIKTVPYIMVKDTKNNWGAIGGFAELKEWLN